MTPQDAANIAEMKRLQVELAISVMENPPRDLCHVHLQAGKYLGLREAIEIIESGEREAEAQRSKED